MIGKPIHMLSFGIFVSVLGSPLKGGEKPLQVFILAGQSNMQGHAEIDTFKAIGMDAKTTPMLKLMIDENGDPITCDRVWISSLGSGRQEKLGPLTAGFGAEGSIPKIGPEFTFGIFMQEHLDAPILIIKTAWGGKSLHTDFRPPSAGPYPFAKAQLEMLESQNKDLDEIRKNKQAATGLFYQLMLNHVKKVLASPSRIVPDYNPQLGYELAGFVWFQGWNDMVDASTYPRRNQPGGYDDYSQLLKHLIGDLRVELKAPNLPFVIGVLGVGGPTADYGPSQQRYRAVHQNFRNAMAAPEKLPEFRDNVAAVLTEEFWDPELSTLHKRRQQLQQNLQQQSKNGQLSPAEINKLNTDLIAENFTDREQLLLKWGISNAEYHYWGSAKIMAQIGKAFAEAIIEIQNR